MFQIRNRHFLALDAALLALASWVAFLARFEGSAFPPGVGRMIAAYLLVALPVRLIALWRMGLYARLWRYAGQADLEHLLAACAVLAGVGLVIGFGAGLVPGAPFARVPLSILLLDGLLGGLAVTVPRLVMRRRRDWAARSWGRRATDEPGRRVLIAGAGAAGAMMARELCSHPGLGARPVAFVDDDPSKRHRRLHGIPVVGGLDQIADIVRKYAIDEVVVAMPAAPGVAVRRVLQATAAVGVATRTVPGLYELLSGRKSVSALRKIEIEDLLRREPVSTDFERVGLLAHERTVLVTGAGGSIGSELCRQIARLRPARLVIVGRGENSIFELVHELARSFPELRVDPVIADVRDRARLDRVFRQVRPHVVFHAAAHKHVPLMEQNVAEAILNNVLGTQVVAEVAARTGVQRFVLISSDKAVRPSSVMGATKRLAEGVVQEVGARSSCRFVSVRFGNVLGSRGSVIPTFLRQIQQGGPVTVTHPEMVRYFMTIPEAVQLVLQAAVMGEGGEVFVLDMGEPVRVVDLARDLIRLSGLSEDEVEVRFTGMRPGEKLYEELFFNEENALPTEHPKVLRARNARLEFSGAPSIAGLIALAHTNAPADELRAAIKALVPEYTGTGETPPRPASPQLVGRGADVTRAGEQPARAVEYANAR
jgi:FlaA1/EpsC-like NDP-sugar epimerase